jgi:hypothetical protein
MNYLVELRSTKPPIYKSLLLQLKWGDGYEGQGEMFYDYNHGPGKYEEPAYAPPPPAYAPPAPAYGPA